VQHTLNVACYNQLHGIPAHCKPRSNLKMDCYDWEGYFLLAIDHMDWLRSTDPQPTRDTFDEDVSQFSIEANQVKQPNTMERMLISDYLDYFFIQDLKRKVKKSVWHGISSTKSIQKLRRCSGKIDITKVSLAMECIAV
jgi:hypothetical protein